MTRTHQKYRATTIQATTSGYENNRSKKQTEVKSSLYKKGMKSNWDSNYRNQIHKVIKVKERVINKLQDQD